jgi:anti-anti-sigma regulatory factor
MTAKRIYEKGGEIVLCCLNEIVRDVFESSQFPMTDTVAAGIEKLS